MPEGTSVVFGMLRAHTNEDYWPEPYKFNPERFLPEEVTKRHPCAYLPFSYGPRNCIGECWSIYYGFLKSSEIFSSIFPVFFNHSISDMYSSIVYEYKLLLFIMQY